MCIRRCSQSITLRAKHADHGSTLQNRRDTWNYKFDSVMHNATQETVYETMCSEVVASAMDGFNGTLRRCVFRAIGGRMPLCIRKGPHVDAPVSLLGACIKKSGTYTHMSPMVILPCRRLFASLTHHRDVRGAHRHDHGVRSNRCW